MQGSPGRARWKRALSRPGVWGVLFGLCFLFFNWPLMAAYLDAPLAKAYLSLFAVWAGFVLCLFVLCRAARSRLPDNEDGKE